VELAIPGKPGTQLLWDPGFHARGAAILEPTTGAALRGTVEVRGRAWHADPFVDLYVDGVWIADMRGLEDGSFLIPWSSDSWPEGGHRLRVIAQAMEGGDFVSRTSEEIGVTVDRTPPLLELTRPAQGAVVRGLRELASTCGSSGAAGPPASVRRSIGDRRRVPGSVGRTGRPNGSRRLADLGRDARSIVAGPRRARRFDVRGGEFHERSAMAS